MRALQIVKPYEFKIVDIPKPKPKRGEVLVRVDYAAICNQNDYKFFYGQYHDILPYPLDPGVYGHEGVGTVVEVGAGVKDLREGDRVILTGHGGAMLYMEYVTRKPKFVVPVSKDKPAEEAATLELMGCAHHAVKLAGNVRNKKVALSGLGPAGLSILQLMLLLNRPKELIGVEISEERAKAARALGLARVVNPADKGEFDALVKESPDLVIETAGNPQAILNAFKFTKREVLLFGFTNEKFEVDESEWFRKEMIIRLSREQSMSDLRAVVKLFEEGRIHTREYLGGVFSFDQYDKAVEVIYRKQAVKVLLKW